MRRSADFGATVKRGRRAVQDDIVIYRRHIEDEASGDPVMQSPRVGLIIAKSVGSAVQRHRVARRLRHVARDLLEELDRGDHVVIRARPGSASAGSEALRSQLSAGLRCMHRRSDRRAVYPVGGARR